MSEIAQENFILLKPNQRVRQIANSLFSSSGIKPRILLETTSLETSLRLTASSMGFCFIPESYTNLSFADKKPKYYIIGKSPLTWTLAVAYRKETYHTKAALAFAQMAKEVKGRH
jgi:DNA-binding transcriptional LysR family regulator